jgi:nitrogen regulatory protein P-II 1
LKKLEAIIRPERITIVKQRLQQLHVGGMTILDATGWSKQREFHLQWRGQEIASDLVPKVKLEVVIPDSAKTDEGEHGDGVIFVTTVDEAVNIGTSHKGEKVIS